MNVLLVRLGALGDLVHAIPAAAAIRRALPDSRIDWLVEARHRPLVDLVAGVDRVVTLDGRTVRAWSDAVRRMRQVQYDIALDLQGLLKSAVLARASGARRVAGFSIWHLREKTARPFYSETDAPDDQALSEQRTHRGMSSGHVIEKNLRLLRVLQIEADRVEFPIRGVAPAISEPVRATIAAAPFALINPGAAWPNKRWPAERYGEVAAFLREVRGLPSFVLWGPGEADLARAVVDASCGAARLAPPTGIADLFALSRAAAVVISGDTGPLHIAAAAGAPIVAVYGPTNPERNGPWAAEDIIVSRFASCACHYQRRCRAAEWCLQGITVAEVTAAIQRRLSTGSPARGRAGITEPSDG